MAAKERKVEIRLESTGAPGMFVPVGMIDGEEKHRGKESMPADLAEADARKHLQIKEDEQVIVNRVNPENPLDVERSKRAEQTRR